MDIGLLKALVYLSQALLIIGTLIGIVTRFKTISKNLSGLFGQPERVITIRVTTSELILWACILLLVAFVIVLRVSYGY